MHIRQDIPDLIDVSNHNEPPRETRKSSIYGEKIANETRRWSQLGQNFLNFPMRKNGLSTTKNRLEGRVIEHRRACPFSTNGLTGT